MNRFKLRGSERGDVLGRDDGPLGDEQVELGVDDRLPVLLCALGREGAARDDTGVADLPDSGG